MSGNRELQAVDISPPLEFDTDIPGPSGVYSRAIATSSQRYEIPAAWKGNFVTLLTSGDCQVLFGDANVAVTENQDSTLSTEALTPNAATGLQCFANGERNFRIPKHFAVTHFAINGGAAGTGRWWAYLSNNLIVDD